jgi:hypothetical protein
MKHHYWRYSISLAVALALLINIFLLSLASAHKQSAVQHRATTKTSHTSVAPTPFMHRPYYGSRSISSRTVSFVDHDHPWYDNDGTFVRYDGAKWTNVSIGTCTGGVNCYDGHNGYDLNMWYEPVLSAAAGNVIRAGWYNPLDHNSSLGLWVAVDHGNGYVTAYGHLSAITVAVGDHVGTQWQIGTSGTTGSSTGPHLHMATYYLPNWQATDPFGWTGNYPDPNAVPDNYLWVSDPSNNTPVPTLSSNGSATYSGAVVVDDSSSGWSSTGSWASATGNTDIQGSLHWVSTSTGAATASATWHPNIPADGYYEVGAFVDDNHASSSWVPYTVYSADPNSGTEINHTVYVDESHIGTFQGPFSQENTGAQWIGLGTYYFKASMNGRLVMSNATGESGLQVSADGVEFVPVSVQTVPSYSFQVTSDNAPVTMLPGGSTQVNLTLKNTGNFTWNAHASGSTQPVQIIYRWLNAQGQTMTISSPFALPQDVGVGSSVSIPVTLNAPMQFGTFTVQWDMQQGTTFFSQQGAQTKNDSIQTVPAYRRVSPRLWRPR